MTVGLVIVSHSTQLAEGVAELAGQMVQGKTPIIAAGGAADNVLGTSVDKILAAIQSLDQVDGVLVLLDLGSALLSAEMALEMLTDEQRARTRLSYAPIVEGAIAASLEASLGRSLAEVARAAEKTASAEQMRQFKALSQPEEEESPALPSPQVTPATHPSSTQHEVILRLRNAAGLHARPASLFVQTAATFKAKIQVQVQGRERTVDATSITGILSLGARNGDTIIIQAQGEDAEAALAALSELVAQNFHEPAAEVVLSAAPTPVEGVVPQAAAGTTQTRWQGIVTSAGTALGPAFLYSSESFLLAAVKPRPISLAEVATEQQRLREAIKSAAQELNQLALDMRGRIGQSQAAIFEAQALMIDDPELLQATLSLIEEQHIDAESALATASEQQALLLVSLDDALLAGRAVDVRDAASRAIRHLIPVGQQAAQALQLPVHPSIFIARDLTPSDTATLDPSIVLGICTIQGGPTSHAAIVARSLGIPAVAGLDEAALRAIYTGDDVGLDADHGLLYHHPDTDVRAELTQRMLEHQQRQAALKVAAQQAQTPLLFRGRSIHLLANVGSEAEAEAARQWGAEGIGLLRTEFLFANASMLPGEEEQRQRYARLFQAFNGGEKARPIVVRTLDAGADKPMPALDALFGASLEANPALGVRGIRIALAHEFLLEQQLSALLLAAAGTGTDLHIMFPMITTVEELRRIRAIVERVYANLKKRQVALPARVPMGIMVEVPSAALMAQELAELADFFSIGANDLLQYTLACDRTNAALSDLYNPMQPAVLRLIRQVAEAGRRAGKPVAVCGEMAGDVRLAPLLIALGVEELSMTPSALPAVRTALSRWSNEELTTVATEISRLKTVAEVEHLYAQVQMKHEKG